MSFPSRIIIALGSVLLVGLLLFLLLLSRSGTPEQGVSRALPAAPITATSAAVPASAPYPLGGPYPFATSIPTSTPTPIPTVAPQPTRVPTSVAPLPAGPAVVFSTLEREGTFIWAASVVEPDKRTILLTIDRADARSIKASLSPDGQWIVYTLLPPSAGTTNPFVAELWVANLHDGRQHRLAQRVDIGRYIHYPVWSPDSTWVVVERQSALDFPYAQTIVAVNVETGEERTLASSQIPVPKEESANWISGLDWSPDGQFFYYQRGTGAPAELWRSPIDQSTAPTRITQISERGIPRCYYFAPDGSALLCLLVEPTRETIIVVPTKPDAAVQELSPGSDFDPIWMPDGQAVVVGSAWGLRLYPTNGQAAQELTLPTARMVAVRSWSPDGNWLAALRDPANEAGLLLISRDGTQERLVIADAGIDLVGWLRNAADIERK